MSEIKSDTTVIYLITLVGVFSFYNCFLKDMQYTILTVKEWTTLYMRVHQTSNIPNKPPNIKKAITWLGKLGGFMARKGEYGTMTLWRGYEILQESIIMLSIVSGKIYG
jgi:hypothetical protein